MKTFEIIKNALAIVAIVILSHAGLSYNDEKVATQVVQAVEPLELLQSEERNKKLVKEVAALKTEAAALKSEVSKYQAIASAVAADNQSKALQLKNAIIPEATWKEAFKHHVVQPVRNIF